MLATDIVAYTYATDIYCPDCVIDALPTEDGDRHDGWALADGVSMPTEENLSELAYAFGINREDESSYDSSDFPKVVFATEVYGDPHAVWCCGGCFRMLDE